MDELEKALEEIVRNFLLHETTSKKSKGDIDLEGNKVFTSSAMVVPDEEFMANLYQCLAEKGILREVISLLRKRLIEVLQGYYPQVVTSGCDTNFSITVVKLLEDFLCCHNMLFTFSVFATEVNSTYKRDFGKLSSFEAENLLEELAIQKNSYSSRKILKEYSENHHMSLLECIIGMMSSSLEGLNAQPSRDRDSVFSPDEMLSPLAATSKRLKSIDHEFAERFTENATTSRLEGLDDRFFQIQLSMERDKEAYLKIAIQREEETAKIRDEIETKLKFEFVTTEKELLRNYDARVAHMKTLLDREKEAWSKEKARKERELFTQRQDLVRLMEHVKEKKVKLKEALQRSEQQHQNSVSNDGSNKKHANLSVRSDDTDTSSDNGRRLKLMKNIQLESIVKRLQEENSRLKLAAKRPDSRHFEKHYSTDEDSHEFAAHCHHPTRSAVDDDKIALLQYTVEKQSDEIENLKQKLRGDLLPCKVPPKSHKSNIADSPFLQDTGLETFLAESKLRFAEIEKKADVMSSSLKEVFKKRHHGCPVGSTAISPTTGKTVVPPSVPKIPSKLKQPKVTPGQPITIPKFSGSGSFDPTLKLFLLSQQENIFTLGANIISDSPHGKILSESLRRTKTKKMSALPPQVFPESKATKPEPRSQAPVSSNNTFEKAATGNINTNQESNVRSKEKLLVNQALKESNLSLEEDIMPPFLLASGTLAPSAPELEAIDKEILSRMSQRSQGSVHSTSVTPAPPKSSSMSPTQKSSKTGITSTATDAVDKGAESSISERSSSHCMASSSAAHDRNQFRTANTKPTQATASSSGALVQFKVPSPEVSQQDLPVKIKNLPTTFQVDDSSWGDAFQGKVGLSNNKRDLSSDNDISFPDASHADGDTFEFMAEEDFWAI